MLGDDDEDPLGQAELPETGEDEARLDGLAEAHLVGEDEAGDAIGEDAPGGADLVREDVDAGGEQRAQAVGAALGLEADHAGAEREGAGRSGVARGEPIEESTGRLIQRGVVRHRGERPIAPRDHGDAFAPCETDRDPAGVLAHLEHDSDAPPGLCPVDELLPLLPGHFARSSTPTRGPKPFI